MWPSEGDGGLLHSLLLLLKIICILQSLPGINLFILPKPVFSVKPLFWRPTRTRDVNQMFTQKKVLRQNLLFYFIRKINATRIIGALITNLWIKLVFYKKRKKKKKSLKRIRDKYIIMWRRTAGEIFTSGSFQVAWQPRIIHTLAKSVICHKPLKRPHDGLDHTWQRFFLYGLLCLLYDMNYGLKCIVQP